MLVKRWMVIAPNGDSVTLNHGGGSDRVYKHKAYVDDATLKTSFPNIFHEIMLEDGNPVKEKKPEILKEIPPRDDLGSVKEEVKEEPKPQLLNEVTASADDSAGLTEVEPETKEVEPVVEMKPKKGRKKSNR